ncbi:MAG: hypothetical protein ACOX4F_07535 [Atopobiaceae bacterium]|jgi:NAD+ synthase (glutamine-hydrolysing)
MKIAIAQIETRAGELIAQADRIVEISKKVGKNTDLLVVPYGTLCGKVPHPELESSYLSTMEAALKMLKEHLACPCLLSFSSHQNVRDAAVVFIKDKKIVAARQGISEFEDDFDEEEWDESPLMDTFLDFDDCSCMVAATEEELFEISIKEDLACDCVIYLPSKPYAYDDTPTAYGASIMTDDPVDTEGLEDSWFICAAPLGVRGTDIFTGGSFVMKPGNEVCALGKSFEEDIITVEIGYEHEDECPRVPVPHFDTIAHGWGALAFGFRSYLDQRGYEDAIVALDGEMTSSALAVLATDALGPMHVHALLAEGLDAGAEKNSISLARNIRIDLLDAPESYQAHLKAQVSPQGPAAASSKRPVVPLDQDDQLLRNLTQVKLASLAAKMHALPLIACDKTGLSLEIDTNDVLAGGLALFGDVLRSDVAKLGYYRNTISPVIPVACLERVRVPNVEREKAPVVYDQFMTEDLDAMLAHFLRGRHESMVHREIVDEELNEKVAQAYCDKASVRTHRIELLKVYSMGTALRDVLPQYNWSEMMHIEEDESDTFTDFIDKLTELQEMYYKDGGDAPRGDSSGKETSAFRDDGFDPESRIRDVRDVLGMIQDIVQDNLRDMNRDDLRGKNDPLLPHNGERGFGNTPPSPEDHWKLFFSDN